MELINRIRKSRKGFTLVEIIVVLVILAILAAFMIPSMLGFINESKKKAAIAEQREIYIAAQAVATEYCGKYGTADGLTKIGVTGTFKAAKDAVPADPDHGVVGSAAVAAVTELDATYLESAAIVTANAAGTDTTKLAAIKDATKTMANYVDTDIHAGDGSTTADTAGAKWTVLINANGRVTKVTYQKDGVKLDDLVPNASMK